MTGDKWLLPPPVAAAADNQGQDVKKACCMSSAQPQSTWLTVWQTLRLLCNLRAQHLPCVVLDALCIQTSSSLLLSQSAGSCQRQERASA